MKEDQPLGTRTLTLTLILTRKSVALIRITPSRSSPDGTVINNYYYSGSPPYHLEVDPSSLSPHPRETFSSSPATLAAGKPQIKITSVSKESVPYQEEASREASLSLRAMHPSPSSLSNNIQRDIQSAANTVVERLLPPEPPLSETFSLRRIEAPVSAYSMPRLDGG